VRTFIKRFFFVSYSYLPQRNPFIKFWGLLHHPIHNKSNETASASEARLSFIIHPTRFWLTIAFYSNSNYSLVGKNHLRRKIRMKGKMTFLVSAWRNLFHSRKVSQLLPIRATCRSCDCSFYLNWMSADKIQFTERLSLGPEKTLLLCCAFCEASFATLLTHYSLS
jgi:hypothetical protein